MYVNLITHVTARAQVDVVTLLTKADRSDYDDDENDSDSDSVICTPGGQTAAII